jgi:hypothetical protein
MNYIAILKYQGKVLGTAFLVSKKLAVTCYHVLAAAGVEPFTGETFQLQFLQGGPVIEADARKMANQSLDTALLSLNDDLPFEIGVPPLIDAPLEKLAGTDFITLGYGRVDNDPLHSYGQMPAQGKIAGLAERDGVVRIQLESQSILPGMSGGPIWAPSLGGVVGMLSARFRVDPMADTHNRDAAWAVQAAHLAQLDPERIKLLPPVETPAAAQRPNKVINNWGTLVTDEGRIINVSNGGTYNEGKLK